MAELRRISSPFIVPSPSGVSIRTRLKNLTREDETVLRAVGAHLGSLAGSDLKARCAAGLRHDNDQWAERKRALTGESSSRWAGAITKASHHQWSIARRAQLAHLRSLETAIEMIGHRLSLPVGQKGDKRRPGGYRSKQEWFAKSRRLHVLKDRLLALRADWDTGRVHVVRGGKRLARHHLDRTGMRKDQWRERWEAERWFFQADGEAGRRYGNETIRVTPDGQVIVKLPAPLAELANASHGRYVLAARVRFAHRGAEWTDQIEADQAVAYRIHLDTAKSRWYLTASWQTFSAPVLDLRTALCRRVVGVDANADHLAAWKLDEYGNPTGKPGRFPYDLSGTAAHRDAQVRHALSRLLRWAEIRGARLIAIEDLDFHPEKTREKHGSRRRFRQLISGFPNARLRDRLVSMANAASISVIGVDPSYTSKWGAQHWQRPLSSRKRKTTRHEAAAVAIGRRAQGLPIRRRAAPPPHDQSDRAGHRTAQAVPGVPGREESRLRCTGPRTRSVGPGGGADAADQNAQDRSGRSAEHTTLSP